MDKAWAEAALRSCNYSITEEGAAPFAEEEAGSPPRPGIGGGQSVLRAGQLVGDGVGSGANSHVKRSCVELTWQDSRGRWGQGAGRTCAWCVS